MDMRWEDFLSNLRAIKEQMEEQVFKELEPYGGFYQDYIENGDFYILYITVSRLLKNYG